MRNSCLTQPQNNYQCELSILEFSRGLRRPVAFNSYIYLSYECCTPTGEKTRHVHSWDYPVIGFVLVTYNDSNLEIRTLDLVYGFFTSFIDLRDGLLKVTTHYHSDSKIVFDNVLLEHGGLFHLSSLLLST